MKTLCIFFDYASPFAYIASEALPRFAVRAGIALDWKPIDQNRLSNYENGLPYSAVKRRYVVLDAVRSAEFHNVPISIPKPHPVKSEAALRLAVATHSKPEFLELHTALFRAAWLEQRDISDRDVLADCVEQASGKAEAWLAEAETDAAIQQLKQTTLEAEALGVFGVPALVLDGELFWGLDSLPILEWRLRNPKAAG